MWLFGHLQNATMGDDFIYWLFETCCCYSMQCGWCQDSLERERVISLFSTNAHRCFHLIQDPNNHPFVRWAQALLHRALKEGWDPQAVLKESWLFIDDSIFPSSHAMGSPEEMGRNGNLFCAHPYQQLLESRGGACWSLSPMWPLKSPNVAQLTAETLHTDPDGGGQNQISIIFVSSAWISFKKTCLKNRRKNHRVLYNYAQSIMDTMTALFICVISQKLQPQHHGAQMWYTH